MFLEKKYCAYSDNSEDDNSVKEERMFQGISMYFNIGILSESLRKCYRDNSYHISDPRPRYVAGEVHNSAADRTCFKRESSSSCSSVGNAFYTETQESPCKCDFKIVKKCSNNQQKREKLSYDPVDYQQQLQTCCRRKMCAAKPSQPSQNLQDCAPKKSCCMNKLVKKKTNPKNEQSWETSCTARNRVCFSSAEYVSPPKSDDRCAKSKKSVKQRISGFFKKRPICKKSCTVDKRPNYTKSMCNSSPESNSNYSPRCSTSIPYQYIGNLYQPEKPKKILKCGSATSSTTESVTLSCYESASYDSLQGTGHFDSVRNCDVVSNTDVQDLRSFTNKQSPAQTTQNPNSQSIFMRNARSEQNKSILKPQYQMRGFRPPSMYFSEENYQSGSPITQKMDDFSYQPLFPNTKSQNNTGQQVGNRRLSGDKLVVFSENDETNSESYMNEQYAANTIRNPNSQSIRPQNPRRKQNKAIMKPLHQMMDNIKNDYKNLPCFCPSSKKFSDINIESSLPHSQKKDGYSDPPYFSKIIHQNNNGKYSSIRDNEIYQQVEHRKLSADKPEVFSEIDSQNSGSYNNEQYSAKPIRNPNSQSIRLPNARSEQIKATPKPLYQMMNNIKNDYENVRCFCPPSKDLSDVYDESGSPFRSMNEAALRNQSKIIPQNNAGQYSSLRDNQMYQKLEHRKLSVDKPEVFSEIDTQNSGSYNNEQYSAKPIRNQNSQSIRLPNARSEQNKATPKPLYQMMDNIRNDYANVRCFCPSKDLSDVYDESRLPLKSMSMDAITNQSKRQPQDNAGQYSTIRDNSEIDTQNSGSYNNEQYSVKTIRNQNSQSIRLPNARNEQIRTTPKPQYQTMDNKRNDNENVCCFYPRSKKFSDIYNIDQYSLSRDNENYQQVENRRLPGDKPGIFSKTDGSGSYSNEQYPAKTIGDPNAQSLYPQDVRSEQNNTSQKPLYQMMDNIRNDYESPLYKNVSDIHDESGQPLESMNMDAFRSQSKTQPQNNADRRSLSESQLKKEQGNTPRIKEPQALLRYPTPGRVMVISKMEPCAEETSPTNFNWMPLIN